MVRHGEARKGAQTREYKAYINAKRRCSPTAHPHHRKYYADKGVQFKFSCYEEFLAHVGRIPEGKRDLDRINTNGNYEHGNVRWATHSENCKNYPITPELKAIRAINMRKAQKLRWPK